MGQVQGDLVSSFHFYRYPHPTPCCAVIRERIVFFCKTRSISSQEVADWSLIKPLLYVLLETDSIHGIQIPKSK